MTSLLQCSITSKSLKCLSVVKFLLAKNSAKIWTQFHPKPIIDLYFLSSSNFVKHKIKDCIRTFGSQGCVLREVSETGHSYFYHFSAYVPCCDQCVHKKCLYNFGSLLNVSIQLFAYVNAF